MAANYGLLNGISAFGDKFMEAYKGERSYQDQKQKDAMDRAMKQRAEQLQASQAGFDIQNGGLVETPEHGREREIKDIGNRKAIEAADENSAGNVEYRTSMVDQIEKLHPGASKGMPRTRAEIDKWLDSSVDRSAKEAQISHLGAENTHLVAQDKEIPSKISKNNSEEFKNYADAGKPQREKLNLELTTGKDLRNEYQNLPQIKNANLVAQHVKTINAAAKNPSAAGDMGMIFAYMKLLDPNSTVREGEQAQAQNAAGVPERLRSAWNNLLNGQRLAPEQRKDFLAQAKNQASAYQSTVNETNKRYTDLAKNYGVRPELIFQQDQAAQLPSQQVGMLKGGPMAKQPAYSGLLNQASAQEFVPSAAAKIGSRKLSKDGSVMEKTAQGWMEVTE